jgi:hypothetical protein
MGAQIGTGRGAEPLVHHSTLRRTTPAYQVATYSETRWAAACATSGSDRVTA